MAKAEKSDFDQVLVRFALERLLYRIGQSAFADKFILKGALLFALWYDLPHRATRDIDLLGFEPSDIASVIKAFEAILIIQADDGLRFDATSMTAQDIRKESDYAGIRISVYVELSRARCRVQIDIGFGDAVTPSALQTTYPTMLDDLPPPQIRVYPTYTVIAEKLHAIVLLGLLNSRLRDYFDLSILITREQLDATILNEAVRATFERRNTGMPSHIPIGLSDEFSHDKAKQLQWNAFLRNNDLEATPLADTVNMIRDFAVPIFRK